MKKIEASAKQGVDDRVGSLAANAEVLGSGDLDGTGKALCRQRGIALEAIPGTHQQQAHCVAPLGQKSSGHEPIATVVAWSGHNHNAGTSTMIGSHAIGHRPPGALH